MACTTRHPAVRASSVSWLGTKDGVQLENPDADLLPLVGEKAATKAWRTWLRKDSEGVADYAKLHDFPGVDATSHLSIALALGPPPSTNGAARPQLSSGRKAPRH